MYLKVTDLEHTVGKGAVFRLCSEVALDTALLRIILALKSKLPPHWGVTICFWINLFPHQKKSHLSLYCYGCLLGTSSWPPGWSQEKGMGLFLPHLRSCLLCCYVLSMLEFHRVSFLGIMPPAQGFFLQQQIPQRVCMQMISFQCRSSEPPLELGLGWGKWGAELTKFKEALA